MEESTTGKDIKNSNQRTEEIQHIIERMPSNFGIVISMIVLFIVTIMLLFGWFVRYPDAVKGQITVNASQAPVKLVALQSGRLQLPDIKSEDTVKEGQVIAWLQNPANLDDVFFLKDLIDSINLPAEAALVWYDKLPKDITLGELSPYYFTFLNAIKQLADYQTNQLYAKQRATLTTLLQQQMQVLRASLVKVQISKKNLELVERFSIRDSILRSQQVLSDADMDRTKLNDLGAEDEYQTAIQNVATNREQISRTESQLGELAIQQTEKIQQLHLDVLTAYNDLRDKMTSWEQRYLFRAPFGGRVQFLNFWSNNQTVQSGQAIFTVIPNRGQVIGQVILPALGAGKVKPNQEAIVKLNDYPYMEYGSITGYVKNISLTTNTLQSSDGKMDTYLVAVTFPDQLKTNYGASLDFRYEMKGTVEIITNDRRLIQRFFDNLKYILRR